MYEFFSRLAHIYNGANEALWHDKSYVDYIATAAKFWLVHNQDKARRKRLSTMGAHLADWMMTELKARGWHPHEVIHLRREPHLRPDLERHHQR